MGLNDKISGQVCDNERARDRENIRHEAHALSVTAWAGLGTEDFPVGYKIDMLEQLVLAVCNLAETIDSQ